MSDLTNIVKWSTEPSWCRVAEIVCPRRNGRHRHTVAKQAGHKGLCLRSQVMIPDRTHGGMAHYSPRIRKKGRRGK